MGDVVWTIYGPLIPTPLDDLLSTPSTITSYPLEAFNDKKVIYNKTCVPCLGMKYETVYLLER